MARLPRVFQKIFGSTAPSVQIGKFGSLAAGSPATTNDPTQIQSLSQFLDGWFSAVLGNNAPAKEDVNALFFLAYRQLAYLFQDGVPLWDASTTYYQGSVVTRQVSGVYLSFSSLVDNNTGNDPASENQFSYVNWQPMKLGVNVDLPGTAVKSNGQNVVVSNFNETNGGNSAGLTLIRGVVASAGSVDRGAGFSIVHSGTGLYLINFTNSFADLPAVVVTPGGSNAGSAPNVSYSAMVYDTAISRCRVQITDPSVTNRDSYFSFIAMGVRGF